jgi:hypothetical protein
MKDELKTEREISECYLEGVIKHFGSISGFIFVVTQLVKNSEGNGRLILADVEEAIARILGELGAAGKPQVIRKVGRGGKTAGMSRDSLNRLYWLNGQQEIETPPPIEEVIIRAAEHLADPNFFIAEISGLLSALIELKAVCHQRREDSRAG